jgi:hypothetical protein
MVDLAEIQAAYYMVAATGVIGALLTAVVGVKSYINANKRSEKAKKKERETRDLELEAHRQILGTRKAQITMGFYDQFASGLWDNILQMKNWKINSIDEFMEMFSESGWERGKMFNSTFVLYETMGVLLHEGLIDIRVLARFIGGFYRKQWERWAPFIQ